VTTNGTLDVQSGKLAVDTSVTTNVDLNVRSGKLLANSTGISTNGNLAVQTDKLSVTSSGVSTSGTLEVTEQTTLNGGLDVTSGSTDVQALTTAGLATLNSAGVTNNLTVGGTSTLAGALTLNASGNGLLVSNNALIQGGLQVNGNLTVDGELTVLTTNNLVVEDPIIELGNVHTQGLGVSYDVGMVFTQPSGSNVATFYDIDATKYRICKTINSAHDTTITSQQAIDMEVTGNVTATDTITANSINLGGSNIRIEGNSIVFG
jgi:hypothetical protein